MDSEDREEVKIRLENIYSSMLEEGKFKSGYYVLILPDEQMFMSEKEESLQWLLNQQKERPRQYVLTRVN
jgi:hypothetical protein